MPDDAIDPAELINPDEAALILRVKSQTLAIWRMNKRGPPFYRLEGRVYYHPGELRTWIAQQRIESAAAAP